MPGGIAMSAGIRRSCVRRIAWNRESGAMGLFPQVPAISLQHLRETGDILGAVSRCNRAGRFENSFAALSEAKCSIIGQPTLPQQVGATAALEGNSCSACDLGWRLKRRRVVEKRHSICEQGDGGEHPGWV